MAITGLTNYLWFDNQAAEAAAFYVDLFPDSSLGEIKNYPDTTPEMAGKVLSASFTLFGQRFVGINGGPMFTHSEAVSFMVECDTQEELDYIWNSLVADGGQESQCGWCKDKFGVSWQVVPTDLADLLEGGAWEAVMHMQKLDIAAMRAAANS